MAQTIKLRRSATSGAQPTTSQLELGELALNTYDGKVYMKKSVGGTESIVEVTSSGGSGATGTMYTDEFSGTGSTTDFTLTVAPVSEDDLIVFIDGVYQNLNSYSISGTTLTFDTAPDNGTTVIVHHIQGGILGTAPVIDTMTGDGSDTTLTLSIAPSSENQTFVTFDGVFQHKSTYSVSGTTLTFSEAVPNGVTVECVTFRNVQVATFEDADGDTKIQVEETADEDKIRFDTDGTERMVIDSSGNVGIGTSSPAHLLHLQGSSPIIRFTDTTTSAFSFITADNGEGSVVIAADNGNTVANTIIGFKIDNSEKVRIDSSGNVGIGTTSPAYKLDVAGEIRSSSRLWLSTIDAVSISGSDLRIGYSNNNLLFRTNSGERMRIDSSGNVGIGTNSPQAVGGHTGVLTLYGSNATALVTKNSSSSSRIAQLGSELAFFVNTYENERMRIDSSGNVGIGTTDPRHKLSVNGTLGSSTFSGFGMGVIGGLATAESGNTNRAIGIQSHATSNAKFFAYDYGASAGIPISIQPDNANVYICAGGGNVGIGTTNPGFSLDITGTYGTSTAGLCIHNNSSASTGNVALISFNTNNTFNGTDVQDITIGALKTNAGNRESAFVINTCIGTGTPTERLRLESGGLLVLKSRGHGAGGGQLALQPQDASDADDEDYGFISFRNNSETTLAQIKGISEGSGNNKSHLQFYTSDGSLGMRMRIRDNGTVQVIGALSKGSGSFEIEHPLESKRETHLLRHSFIEGPQCDNIYRGTVTLTDGSATVNLDSVSNMTNGTFVALNTDVQVFTTNETDWDAVKGSVSGNILTITCQNSSSTATVSWLVIAERQDDNIISSAITDEYGKLVVEPEVYEGGT